VKTVDTVIAGGGIIGGAIALALARTGQRVVLLDRQQPGMEASWAAAGMLAPGAETLDSVAVAPLGKASLELYPEFIRTVESVAGCAAEFELKPGLQVFFGEAAEGERAEFVALQRQLNLPAEEISVAEARRMEPELSAEARTVARLAWEARVDNRLLLHAVFAAAGKSGVEIRAGEAVTGLLRAGAVCEGLRTAQGEVRAANVVICAGSFASQIPDVARYAPTVPVRGQMLALRADQQAVQHVLRSHRGYIVPRKDGRMICGSTAERVGYEKRVTPEGIEKILSAARELAPALSNATVVETWSGLRPDTPDHLPAIGPTDVRGLWIAAGHYRNGILLTPITAKTMVEYITTGKTSLADAQKYSPLRFA